MKYIIHLGKAGGDSSIIGWAHDVTTAVSEVARIVGKDAFAGIQPIRRGKADFLFNFIHENKTKWIKIEKVQEVSCFDKLNDVECFRDYSIFI